MVTLSEHINSFINKMNGSKPISAYKKRRTKTEVNRQPVEDISPTDEINRQLMPKGPYRSTADITNDVRESARLARKLVMGAKPSSAPMVNPGAPPHNLNPKAP